MRIIACWLSLLVACVSTEQLGEETFELNGSNPGKVTTVFGGDYVNRCAVDPVGNLTGLPSDPSYIISYWSGQGGGFLWSGNGMDHRQSIQRLYRGGVNFLLVSMSVHDGYAAGFELVRMLDHSTTLRLTGLAVTPWGTPMDNDYVVGWYNGVPSRTHAGGMQMMGRFAAVSFEDGGTAYFQLFDFADPYNAIRAPATLRQAGQTSNAGAVAITRTDDDFFLAMVFGNGSSDVEVFRSSTTSLPGFGGGSWISKGAWSTGWGPLFSRAYQNVQFVTKCDGQLFLLATHQNGSSEDWADLYRVTLNTTTFKPTMSKVAQKRLTCRSANTGGMRYCDFAAGAGPYVDSNGGLVLYGIEHSDNAFPHDGSAVKLREF